MMNLESKSVTFWEKVLPNGLDDSLLCAVDKKNYGRICEVGLNLSCIVTHVIEQFDYYDLG
jgi:hypothetical protein